MPRRLMQEEFVEKFEEIFGNDEYEVFGEYINNYNPINIKHKNCGFEFYRNPKRLIKNKVCICPKCYPNDNRTMLIPYINDISVVNKELHNLLLDKEDGHRYKSNSKHHTYFVCPNCGKILYKCIYDVNIQGLSCDRCGDGISYPEKFISSILNQLHVDYFREFSPDWIAPKSFDFMFNFNNNKYIIEVDGAFHFNDNKMNNTTFEESKFVDIQKEKLAIINGYNVIRIDANYSNSGKRYEYLLNSIKESELYNLFDLSNIDYKLCNKYANSSNMVSLANDWNNGIQDYDVLKSKYKISRNTITKMLKRAAESGIVNNTYEEIKKINFINSHIKIAKKRKEIGISVMCNETGEIFNSCAEANKKYHGAVEKYIKGNRKYAGTLSDGTRLTWTKLN